MKPSPARALGVLVRAARRREFDVKRICHTLQIGYVESRARNITVCAGRRSGKTRGAIVKGVKAALGTPNCNVLYVAASRPNAKTLAWRPLKALLQKYFVEGQDYELNVTELSVTFTNGSCLRLTGVANELEADKCRGIPALRLVIVDECQMWKDDLLRYFLRDVVRPGMLDMGALSQLVLSGTARRSRHGLWWERINAEHWEHHYFTIFDNKFIPDPDKTIEEDLKAENQSRDGDWFQCEYMAVWLDKIEDRVYHYDAPRNVYTALPDDLMSYLIAADIGTKDNDHVSVLGWNDYRPDIYLTEEHQKAGQTVTALGKVLRGVYDRLEATGRVWTMVADSGGGGLKTIITIRQEMDLPLEAAEKPPVEQQVRICNGYLDTGRLKVRDDSFFARDCRQASWVSGVVGGQIREKVHSDACPTMRYGLIAGARFFPAIDIKPPTEELSEGERIAQAQRFPKRSEFDDLGDMWMED